MSFLSPLDISLYMIVMERSMKASVNFSANNIFLEIIPETCLTIELVSINHKILLSILLVEKRHALLTYFCNHVKVLESQNNLYIVQLL